MPSSPIFQDPVASAAPAQRSSRLRDGAKGMALFALLGPPLGGLVFFLALEGIELRQGKLGGENVSDHFIFASIVLVLSYPVGVIPAAIAGLLLGLLRPMLIGWRAAAWGAIVGGMSVMACLAAVLGSKLEPDMLLAATFGLIPGALLAHKCFGHDGAPSVADRHSPTQDLDSQDIIGQ